MFIPSPAPLAHVRLLGLLGLQAAAQLPRVHLGAREGPQTSKPTRSRGGSDLFQRVSGGRGPVNSTAETYRMKGPSRKGGVPSAERTVGQQLLGCFRSKRYWGRWASLWTWSMGEEVCLFQSAQAKPQLTLRSVAGGPGRLNTRKAGVGASEAWKGVTHPPRGSVSPAAPTLGSTLFPPTSGSAAAAGVGLGLSPAQRERRRRFPAPYPTPAPAAAHPRPKVLRGHHLGSGGGRKVL